VKGWISQIHAPLERLLASISRFDSPNADRVKSDLSAAMFHLSRTETDKPLLAMIGGTGTGKSTVVNRLLRTDDAPADLTATSFRRTFTAGPIAITSDTLPAGFGSLIHVDAEESPARGKSDRITLVKSAQPLLQQFTLIDTPDIDGELTDHHAAADRVFRWADGVIFLVTPEKYQMPELQPYYRLAQRYGLATLFVMNKVDESEAVDDYAKLLARSGVNNPIVLALARDDSTWQPAPDASLAPSRLVSLKIVPNEEAQRARVMDVLGRINDQLLNPMLDQRTRIDRAIAALRTLAGDAIEVNVHPLTQQLQRRLREKSVLYLIGPQRMLDRVRSVPSMLVRLPKSMWTWTKTGDFALPGVNDVAKPESPDFRSIVVDQFQSLQSRIDDLLKDQVRLDTPTWKIPTNSAGNIVDEELGKLKAWLETKWNAAPRDTAILNKLLKVIPGAGGLNKYSEAAPYLLAIVCVTHGAFFGHLDLMILGGYSAFTWLTEKISDEVASQTRATNRAIATRYEALARTQIESAITWLERQAPSREQLTNLRDQLDSIRG